METQTTRKKEWTLTQAAFDKLLSRLDDDRERAGEKYEDIRLKLCRFFESRGSFTPDAHADEALNRFARKIDEGEAIENLQAYVFGIARLLFLDSLKLKNKEQAAIEQLPTFHEAEFDRDDDDESNPQYECFQRCLRNLPDENRALILEYYQKEKHEKIERRKTLAERFGLPLNALRIRACRIRAKLESCVSECVG